MSMHDVLGVERPTDMLEFEVPVEVEEHACFIDVYIRRTRVLIEQKSRGIDLEKPARQSDGMFLTPFEQAKRYADELSYSRRPRWIITSNFDQIRIYDMDCRDNNFTSFVIKVERLVQDFSRLNFLIDPEDEDVNPAIRISKRAGEIVGDICTALEKQCVMRNAQCVMGSDDFNYELSTLCVRLVFCLYAEDAFIFKRNQFTDYIRNASDRRAALIELFDVLNTPKPRPKSLRAELKAFPYVNGDLFKDSCDIPPVSAEAAHYLLIDAGDDNQFNWLGISPTIFGALFESTLNPITRRKGGMHYTSPDNIHKVIDPLFMDELHDEFRTIRRKRKNRQQELEKFQLKLASLKFLDPACGSGNFLTETYISIRTLENEVIRELHSLGVNCKIEVSIENFYGIEINDFAVAVARTALLIAENQMKQETEMIIHKDIEYLPLRSTARIESGNALRLDWNEVVPDGVDYIIGNPPFVGFTYQTDRQKADLQSIFPTIKNLDYVTCWFKKAADFMIGTQTRAAFVSTNSIVQGESVGLLWSKLFETIHIDFAHRTFRWLSESDDPAAVHCVIIGFSHAPSKRPKIIFDGKEKSIAKNINGYLLDAPDFFVESRSKPLCNVPKILYGNKVTDDGNLIIEVEDYDDFIAREPAALKFIRRLIGSNEFINGKDRYCLWLVDATPDDLKLPLVAERVEAVRQFRLHSISEDTRKLAATPHLFEQINQPKTEFIVVPRVSSKNRRYVPMGFVKPNVIVNNAVSIIPNANMFHFGVLESIVHMAWMRVTCVRLRADYNYSNTIVYNNFPWCEPSAKARQHIRRTAKRILEVRERYPDKTLAWLYNPETMPKDLRAAHSTNDRAVLEAYGFDESMSEEAIIERLMQMYRNMKIRVDGDFNQQNAGGVLLV